ncbi:hypothetical protein BDF21DRAFT_447738 [Thamnidium elegans]|nr:hypothetical protein BDF21DRAFT_396298 [Thamnidium elegans]KAI8095489.1 hypothetical protein BDF21DRAFT_447738 [Thamnidium elegans]
MFIESYQNLKHIFDNEDNALNYLIENKYVNKFDKCSICNYDMKLNFKKKLYVCKAPSSFISSSLQIDKNTYIKDKQLIKPRNKIGGRNEIVEIDETKIAKRKYNKGHSVEGAWVIGEPIEERNIENINEIIEKYIKKDPVTGVHTNTIEGTWNGLKQKNKCSREIYYETKENKDEEYNHISKNTNIENTLDFNIDDNNNNNICEDCGFEINENGCICPDIYNSNTLDDELDELYEESNTLSDVEMGEELLIAKLMTIILMIFMKFMIKINQGS